MSSSVTEGKAARSARVPWRRRISAYAAIAFLVAALATFVAGIIHSGVWRWLVAGVAILVMVVALWTALTRRGVVRMVSALVVVLSLAAVLVVVLTAHHRGLLVVLAFVWVVASSLTARYALGRDRRTLHAWPAHHPHAPRAEHPALLMNPRSGGGKVEKFDLEAECRSRGIQPIVLKPGDDLLHLAEDAIARGADVIGMAGGDGSQALVATVAMRHGIPHVCVPAGTRNHFALDLGLDRDDVVGALDAFTDAHERTVDLARVNGRVFVNNASLGLYAKIVQSDSYRDAKLKTSTDLLPVLIGPDAEPFDLRFTGPDGVEYSSVHLIMVSNNTYELQSMAGFGTRPRIDAGTLGIVTVRIASAAEAATFVALEAAGRANNFKGWMGWEAPTFEVDSSSPIEIGIDGEATLMDPPLRFESLPGALRVRIPRHAPGHSPAEASVRLSVATVASLARVAALGRP